MGELTGWALDAAVAEVLGWRRLGEGAKYHLIPPGVDPGVTYSPTPPDMLPADTQMHAVPRYSDPDCSGLGPVLAWLRENCSGRFCVELRDGSWTAETDWADGWGDSPGCYMAVAYGSTLPLAACRLLVSWAKRKAERT